MKNQVRIYLFVALILYGMDALGQNSSFGYKQATKPEGEGLTFGNVFGFGNINGLLPGAIYVSVSTGPSFIYGDVCGPTSKDISFGKNNMFDIGVSRVFRGNFGYEISYMYGKYDGSDAGTYLAYRGYCYSTNISEVALTGEWYLFGGPYAQYKIHSFYLLGGFGLVFSNCNSYGKEPLPGRIYQHSAGSPSIPFGACYLINLNSNIQIGVEVAEHYVFNDYLDGVKPVTDGNKSNDVLGHFALKLRIHLYQDNNYE